MAMNTYNDNMHIPNWVTEVSNSLSGDTETIVLWEKILTTFDSEGTSIGKNYLRSQFETMQNNTSKEIENINNQIGEEHES